MWLIFRHKIRSKTSFTRKEKHKPKNLNYVSRNIESHKFIF